MRCDRLRRPWRRKSQYARVREGELEERAGAPLSRKFARAEASGSRAQLNILASAVSVGFRHLLLEEQYGGWT